MKTLKSILLGLAIFTVCGAAKATEKPERLTKSFAISTYIDAMSRGKLQGLDDVVDANTKFSMLRGNQLVSFTKIEMLGFLKKSEDVKQDCIISSSEVETNNEVTVVKVDMQYDGFLRSNYVTIANTGAGWKITNVYSTFTK